MDQPMSRRERRERERAEAAARGEAHPPGAHPPAADSSPAGPSEPGIASAGSAGSGAPAAGGPSAAPPGAPAGGASGRPMIRRAARTEPAVPGYPRTAPEAHGSGPGVHGRGAQGFPPQGQPPTAGLPTQQMQVQPGAAQQWPPHAAPAQQTAAQHEHASAAAGGARRTRRERGKPEREPLGPVRATVRTFGELCITAGLVLILFVVWQLWWTDIAANRDNEVLADQLVTEWRDNPANELPDDPDTPVVGEPVAENTAFGIMYVPRFGEDYYRTIAEGVSMEPVLNRMGLGRYPTSAMPGEVGNFSMAGHRVTYGKPLNQIHQLRPGDEIVVQTAEGFYTYTFRNFEIVLPDATDVLSAVPTMPEYKGKDRIMTLTACNPMFSARERYIAYAELSDWQPAAEGAPDSIKDFPAYDRVGGDA